MKKLMFATALAASVAAFADPLNAISFEGYEKDEVTIPTLLDNGEEILDDAVQGARAGYTYFFFTNSAGGANSSIVTNHPGGTEFTSRPKYYADLNGAIDKYLALDTEGGTLWRNINKDTEEFATRRVVATGTYLDTLVQFTVTEDDAPTTTSDDKLAIWLGVSTNAQGEVTGTNLMVRANYWEAPGEDPVPTDFVTTGATIIPGNWYRLTVKAIPTVMSRGVYPAFQIFVDGNEIASLTAQYSDGEDGFQDTASAYWSEGMGALAAANKLFPTLAEKPDAVEDVTLQGVGFQGTGAVDEIVWTEDDPLAGDSSGIEFTLTWTAAEVTAVSYVLSADEATTNTLTSGTAATIPAGTTGTITFIPTFEAGYEFDYLDMGEHLSTLTIAIPAESTNATLVAKAYPTYLKDADATIKAKYDTWKGTYKPDTSSQWETAFLLNMNPDTPVASGTALLKIASITEVSGGWELEIVSDATTLTADTNSDGIVGNGYLAITYAADLATLTSGGTTVNLPVTVTSGAIKVTVPTASGAKFMKAKLSATAEPQN